MERSFLTFLLAGQLFGIDVQKAKEIMPLPEITMLGKAPAFIEGFINLHGALILVVNMREILGLEGLPLSLNNYVINIEIDGMPIGFIVDRIKEIVTVQDSKIAKPPKRWKGLDIRYVAGIVKRDEDTITLIDMETLFTDKEKGIIETSARRLSEAPRRKDKAS
ncbi:MAG: purine-binding chemotaxis protein CheW [Nitrospirae bacterium]|nr:purine-binding chemotaxis protein CheW [Nitrospirota bacterium]